MLTTICYSSFYQEDFQNLIILQDHVQIIHNQKKMELHEQYSKYLFPINEEEGLYKLHLLYYYIFSNELYQSKIPEHLEHKLKKFLVYMLIYVAIISHHLFQLYQN